MSERATRSHSSACGPALGSFVDGRRRRMASKVDESHDGAGSPASEEPKAVHLTPAERAARGKAARSEVPRASHATVEISDDRDSVALLDEGTALRVPELVPIRYGRMLTSPFAMYRGA